ncbi:MAG TPA: FAD-dependent oxidoreductase [Burkholderiales bacterium]|nr:FAD-dependent oxidoreductase [Burkholderiales bacterium]
MSRARLAVVLLFLVALAVFFAAGGHRYFSFENLKAQQAALQAWREVYPGQSALAFFLLYVAFTSLSLPAASLLTLLAGAIFGLGWGVLIVSFASAIGATIAMLAARFVLHDWVQERFRAQLQGVNRGVEKEGAFYLFTLRLIPAVPYFLINLAMGLTPIRAWTFYWVSQVAMFPATVLYVNAGTQLARLDSLRGILSWQLIGALVLLGLFPLVAKKAVDFVSARRVYARWTKPRRFDRNMVVIGAGSAGLVAAYIAAAVRAKVTLVEKDRMGGDCLNTGCVPSKALIKTARVLSLFRNSRAFGIKKASAEFDFADVMERVQRVIRAVEPHDSVERYTQLGVECIKGEARITTPWSVEIKTTSGEPRLLTTRSIVIAAGAEPFIPPIPGIERMECLTSETLWELRELPPRLLVLGGGPIGSELAQAFARLGSKVTQVEMLSRILPREDPEFSEMVAARMREDGVDVRVGHKATRFLNENLLVCEHEGKEVRIEFDALLCAVGRVARTKGYGLEELGIAVTKARTVETNEFLQTVYPNIYACGDVAGPYQFTHTAAHQAWYASVNALFGALKKFRADYSVIPWATFTDPEVARVGLNETEARERGIPYEVSVYGIDELDRAIADEAAHGRVKVLTAPGKDRILGATIAGEHAGDLIMEFVAAMRHGFGLNKILGTIHVYPTFAEANKYAAGVWKKAHAPQRLLARMEKLHAWMRG